MRVAANNMYSCLMQKTQRFSSLFRHYSKHHGLPRESLDFFFTVRSHPVTRESKRPLGIHPKLKALTNAALLPGVGRAGPTGPRGLPRDGASAKGAGSRRHGRGWSAARTQSDGFEPMHSCAERHHPGASTRGAGGNVAALPHGRRLLRDHAPALPGTPCRFLGECLPLEKGEVRCSWLVSSRCIRAAKTAT